MSVEYHIPVLVHKVVELLRADSADCLVDATLGDAGYSLALLKSMPESGRIIGIDQDKVAIGRAEKRLGSLKSRITIVQDNFRNIDAILQGLKIDQVDGIVADLGVSRLQISDPGRGFMYMKDGPLRMTMNRDAGYDAEMLVNESEREELVRIIRDYGEERFAKRIVNAIIRQRQVSRITTTDQLKSVLQSAVGRKYEIKTFARCFQAIRIAVNNELDSLQAFLPAALNSLASGGRLAVISYHSLEDRMVKRFMRNAANPCECPKEIPVCVCGKKPTLSLLGKPIFADEAEVAANSSARSAVMRVAIKL